MTKKSSETEAEAAVEVTGSSGGTPFLHPVPPLQPNAVMEPESAGPIATVPVPEMTDPPLTEHTPPSSQPSMVDQLAMSTPVDGPQELGEVPGSDPEDSTMDDPGEDDSNEYPGTVPVSPPMDDVQFFKLVDAEIVATQSTVKFSLGFGILHSNETNMGEAGNPAHRAIWEVRWNADNLHKLTIEQLNGLEIALTGHQTYVQTVENEWHSYFHRCDAYYQSLMSLRRSSFKGETAKSRETQAVMSDPELREAYQRYLVGRAMYDMLEDMGKRFAQMEDGLKRTITNALSEREHERKQGQFNV